VPSVYYKRTITDTPFIGGSHTLSLYAKCQAGNLFKFLDKTCITKLNPSLRDGCTNLCDITPVVLLVFLHFY